MKIIKSVAINILMFIGLESLNFFIFLIGGIIYYFYYIFSNALVPQMYKKDYLLRSIYPIALSVIFHFISYIIEIKSSTSFFGFGLLYFLSIGMFIISLIASFLFVVFNRGSYYFDE